MRYPCSACHRTPCICYGFRADPEHVGKPGTPPPGPHKPVS